MDTKELYEIFLSCGGRVSTDSRNISGGELFFALRGENFDGNAYAAAALENGAFRAVVDASSAAAASGDSRMIAVEDTLSALKSLAAWHREHILVGGKRLPVVGLTGTNGKTTTKELIRTVLSAKYRVTATEGNLNNDIGVPLSVLKIGPDTEIAVIEMGANHPDDIAALVPVSRPDFGLITNVGKGHLLGFGSFEGVKRAKGQLYDYLSANGGTAFVNADDPVLTGMAAERRLDTIPYGLEFSGGKVLPASAEHPFLRIELPGLLVETNLVGAYNADNVLAAMAVGRHFGISAEEAAEAIATYRPTLNRSQMVITGRNTVIGDYYNANPSSMTAALGNLAGMEACRKAALLGEMRELGDESLAEHASVLRRLLTMDLQLVCLVGEEFIKAAGGLGGSLPESIRCFAGSSELASWLHEHPIDGHTVLVKGSRGVRMENVMPEL